jgi:hypothetical protein
MAAHKGEGVQWRHTSVLIRADIFAHVQEQGLNISHECNRALADLVGIDYRQQQLPQETTADPVIIAPEQKTDQAPAGPIIEKRPLRPVLNADDPRTPVKVLLQKKDPASHHPSKKSAVSPGREQTKQQAPSPQSTQPAPLPHSREKGRAKPAKRAGRDTAVQRFVTANVVRTEGVGGGQGVVPKDEMYQRFVRWCKADSISPVPDKRSFSVALKNRFVIQQATVNDVPCWVNVTIK